MAAGVGGLSRRSRAALSTLIGIGLLTSFVGCGDQREDAVDEPDVETTALPAPSPLEPEPLHGAAPFRAHPESCKDAALYLDDVFLDAATGHRYLALRLRNCSARPVRLDRAPQLVLRTVKGTVVQPRVDEWERRPPVRIPPAGHAFLGLEYLAADLKPRAAAVTLSAAGEALSVTGELDLDTRTPITIYPWVLRGKDLWRS